MRVVLDTNVLVSALIKEGKPRHLLHALLTRSQHRLVLSDVILEELSKVIDDQKIRKYVDDKEYTEFLTVLLSKALFVQPTTKASIFGSADDAILDTAKEGKASFLVTGDRHILELHDFKSTKIVSVKEMLSLLSRP